MILIFLVLIYSVTGYAGTQKVTTYNKVVPYAFDFEDPRFFIEFCEGKHRFYGLGFHLMDTNNDGKVSFGEVSVITQDPTEFQNWISYVETSLQFEIQIDSGMCSKILVCFIRGCPEMTSLFYGESAKK